MFLTGTTLHGASKHDATVTTLTATTGNYAGDNTQNRAIAHGLGRVPKFIMFQQIVAGDSSVLQAYSTINTRIVDTANTTVTAWDATSVYVGGVTGAVNNVTGSTYYWVAI